MNRFTWIVPFAVVACSHQAAKPPAAAAPAPEPAVAASAPAAAPEAAPAPAPQAAAPATCATDRDCGGRQLCVESRCTDITPGLAACRNATVHFAFDSAELVQDELAPLQRLARCASAGAAPSVLVEGNADERGTVEYNLALGDRRASAVAKYLEALGLERAKLKTVSYGKEKPLCTEHNEACWRQNRRAAVMSGDEGAAGR
jgi:peptidoglycan-associated lipoprotein